MKQKNMCKNKNCNTCKSNKQEKEEENVFEHQNVCTIKNKKNEERIHKENKNQNNTQIKQDFINLWDKIYNFYNLVVFDCPLYIDSKYLVIDSMIIKSTERKKGIGTMVMREIINFADKYSLTIYLEPSSIFGTPEDVLIKFYSKFGFEKVLSHNKACIQFQKYYFRKPNKI